MKDNAIAVEDGAGVTGHDFSVGPTVKGFELRNDSTFQLPHTELESLTPCHLNHLTHVGTLADLRNRNFCNWFFYGCTLRQGTRFALWAANRARR